MQINEEETIEISDADIKKLKSMGVFDLLHHEKKFRVIVEYDDKDGKTVDEVITTTMKSWDDLDEGLKQILCYFYKMSGDIQMVSLKKGFVRITSDFDSKYFRFDIKKLEKFLHEKGKSLSE